jgi:hypothetical protein
MLEAVKNNSIKLQFATPAHNSIKLQFATSTHNSIKLQFATSAHNSIWVTVRYISTQLDLSYSSLHQHTTRSELQFATRAQTRSELQFATPALNSIKLQFATPALLMYTHTVFYTGIHFDAGYMSRSWTILPNRPRCYESSYFKMTSRTRFRILVSLSLNILYISGM